MRWSSAQDTRRLVGALPPAHRHDDASEFSLSESDRAREPGILRRACTRLPTRAHPRERWLERVGLAARRGRCACAPSRAGWSSGCRSRARCSPSPTLLLLDEPFAALDPDGVALVAALIREAIARGMRR